MSNLFDLYRSENSTRMDIPQKRIIRRPNILARPTMRKVPSVTVISTTATSNASPVTTSSNSQTLECKNIRSVRAMVSPVEVRLPEAKVVDCHEKVEMCDLGCSVLDDLLRKHKPLGVVDHAPFYDVTLVMSFGDDQGSSKDYVHPIGFAYGERALAAFRVVSKTAKGFQFKFRKRPANERTLLISQTEAACVRSGSHITKEDEDPPSPPLEPTKKRRNKRLRKKKSNFRKARTGYSSKSTEKEENSSSAATELGIESSSGRTAVNEETDVPQMSPGPSYAGGNNSMSEDDEIIFEGEHLNDEEKTLVDQVMLLCRQYIVTVDYADPDWYRKLKLAIVFRLKKLMEDVKYASARRRELREKNEELRRCCKHFVEQARVGQFFDSKSSNSGTVYLEDKTMEIVAKKKRECLIFNRTEGEIMNM